MKNKEKQQQLSRRKFIAKSAVAATALTIVPRHVLGGVVPAFGVEAAFTLFTVEKPSAEPFVSGDTVCWIGDSITHAGKYHSIVQLFYYTRYPDRVIKYHNCGFGGDTAEKIMGEGTKDFRFNHDILSRKPTVSTIMLGMNDVGLGFMKLEGTLEERQSMALANYEKYMKLLIQELIASGSRIILIQPSIYDATVVMPDKPDTREGANAQFVLPDKPDTRQVANAGLGQCADRLVEWSKNYKTGLVDFYHPMKAINTQQQKKDASFTIVSKDRIHPGSLGHFVMAYSFLKDTGVTSCVADMKIDAREGSVISAVNCDIANVEASKNIIAFKCMEKSLPFPVAGEYTAALDLVPFTDELNREILTIANLPEGVWSVEIDDQKCGEYSSAEFSAGINLATNVNTPQYKQALGIMELNAERQSLEGLNRNASNLEYFHAKNGLDPVGNVEKVREIFKKQLESQKESNKPNVPFVKLLEINANPQVKSDLLNEIEALVQKIRTNAKPKEHRFKLTLQAK